VEGGQVHAGAVQKGPQGGGAGGSVTCHNRQPGGKLIATYRDLKGSRRAGDEAQKYLGQSLRSLRPLSSAEERLTGVPRSTTRRKQIVAERFHKPADHCLKASKDQLADLPHMN
jgi:hypothetical protein